VTRCSPDSSRDESGAAEGMIVIIRIYLCL
jgi:hypothetical protein